MGAAMANLGLDPMTFYTMEDPLVVELLMRTLDQTYRFRSEQRVADFKNLYRVIYSGVGSSVGRILKRMLG